MKYIQGSKFLVVIVSLNLCLIISQVLCQSQVDQVQKVSNENVANDVGAVSSGFGHKKPEASNSNAHFVPPAIGSNNQNGDYREYGPGFYYPVQQKQIIWNRDSYADAASDFGYNHASQHQSHHGNTHSFIPNTDYGTSVEGHEDGGLGTGGLGGGLGILGLLGLKGLGFGAKGLGLVAIAKGLGLALLAFLLPALLLLPLIALFFPVPIITLPSTPAGRTFKSGFFKLDDVTTKMTQLARSVLDSDKCVERMSCELSKVSKGSLLDKTLKRVFSKLETHLPKSLQRMAQAYMDQSSYCNKKYACYLVDDNEVSKST